MAQKVLLSSLRSAWVSPITLALLLVLEVAFCDRTAHAAIKRWTGDSTSGNWSAPANWNPPGAPANGDELLFVRGSLPVADLLTTNNLADLRLNSITFDGPSGGFFLHGNPITLTNGILAMHGAAPNTVALVLTNGTTQIFSVTQPGGTLNLTGDIDLNRFHLTFDIAGQCNASNVIRGAGTVSKHGAGTLTYGGTAANTYTGSTSVNGGRLELAKSAAVIAIGGDSLLIGDGATASEVRLLSEQQLPHTMPITLNLNGILNLNNFNDDVGPLTILGGTVTTGTGIINPGDITALDSSSIIMGRLTLGPARTWTVLGLPGVRNLTVNAVISGSGNLIKNGRAAVRLSGANTFGGSLTIDEGEVVIEHNAALGAAGASGITIVNTNATLSFGAGLAIGQERLTLGEGATLEIPPDLSASSWAGPITLNNMSGSHLNAYSTFTHSGQINGEGDLTIRGDGLILSGGVANIYLGDTFVRGFLRLNKSLGLAAIPGNGALYIHDGATVRLLALGQIPTITIVITAERGGAGGWLDLNGFRVTAAGLSIYGGRITTGGAGGALALAGNVNTLNGLISGNLDLGTDMRTFTVEAEGQTLQIDASIFGTGGIFKDGPGSLYLRNNNTYSGLTVIAQGDLSVGHPSALGSITSGTIQTDPGPSTLTILVQGGLEPLSLQGVLRSTGVSNSWAGNITLSNDVTLEMNSDFLDLSGSISGDGDLTIAGYIESTVIFSGATANSYGDTFVDAGTLRLAKTIPNAAIAGDLRIGTFAAVQLVGTVQQIANTSRVNILSQGLLDIGGVPLERVGATEGAGQINLGNGTLETGDGTSTTFSGVISGTGRVVKRGTGAWTLSGANTYSGLTTVNSGTLIVNGPQPQSPVTVLAAGTLGGSGVVGNINAAGTVAPGSSVGTLTCSNLVFTSTGALIVELDGDALATRHDQLNVRGTNSLAGATFNALVRSGFAPSPNQTFDIILNDGTDAIPDTFGGLPADSVFTAGPHPFRISYAGGSGGNDVRLTVLSNALRFASAQNLSGGNRNAAADPNECDNLSVVAITNVSETLMTGVSATLVPRTPGMTITQPFSEYPDIPAGGRASNLTPFQVSFLPGYQCGEIVRFDLVVQTAGHGNYRIPFGGGFDDSGEEGPLMRFDNNTSASIPDVGTTNSTIDVSGIDTPVRRVAVSLHITHSAVEDLDISLISPGGVAVALSSDNGGTGSDYGAACADAQRTRFEAGAANAIATGTPPFVGTFAPEGSLAAFNGSVGAQVNGAWTLRVTDDAGGALGTLRCWSLFIAPTVCPEGSGPCESCPERTIYGFLNQGSPTAAARLIANAQPSVCGTSKSCPSPFILGGPYHFDAYTFVNGESSACITVRLGSEGCDLFSAAYRNSYNPAALCGNYLADIGLGTTSGGSEYSFQVNPHQHFVIVVNEVVPNAPCRYALTVSGGSCQPVLDIDEVPNNRVALDWSTAAIGYSLERTNALASAPAWLPVTTTPIITDSRFRVTNNITGSANFYRLRKP